MHTTSNMEDFGGHKQSGPGSCASSRTLTFLVTIPALIIPSLTALFYFVILNNLVSVRSVFALDKTFLVFWPLVSVFLVLRRPFPTLRLDIRKHLRALPLGIAVGLAILVFRYLTMQTAFGNVVEASSWKIQAKMETLGFLRHFWLFALLISILHSLIEEFYWRWFIFGRLRTIMPISLAHMIAGIFFATYHVIIVFQLLPGSWCLFGALAGVGGIIWSVMYQHQKTLAGAWISHIIVDLGIMATAHKAIFGTYF